MDFSFSELYAFILALVAMILTHMRKKKDKDRDKQEK